jgi:hypothetical protein
MIMKLKAEAGAQGGCRASEKKKDFVMAPSPVLVKREGRFTMYTNECGSIDCYPHSPHWMVNYSAFLFSVIIFDY